MKNVAIQKIGKLLDTGEVVDYDSWKKSRSMLVSALGRFLLSFSEVELSAVYSGWESEFREKAASEAPEKQLASMLLASLLHYFRRSFDQINRFFPLLNNFMGSQNRDVCRTACHMLRDLMAESSDNAPFLREALESAKVCLQPQKRKDYLFNAMFILKEVGRFFPTDVFGVTLSHFPEIWNAACSKDRELRLIAVKVIDIHLRHVPTHTAKNFAESMFIDCMAKMASENHCVENFHGPILICKSLYHHYPDTVKVRSLIDRIGVVCQFMIPEMDVAVFGLVLLIAEARDPSFTVQLANHVIMLLISNILNMKTPDCGKHLEILERMLVIVDPITIPTSSIVEMVQFIIRVPEYGTHMTNQAFGVLRTLMEIQPDLALPEVILEEAIPCENYLKVLKLLKEPIVKMHGKLLDFFRNGQQPDSSNETKATSILLARDFRSIIGTPESVFSRIFHFVYSDNEELRFLMTDTLASFATKTADEELLRLAVYDHSKKVRLAAVRCLAGKEIPASVVSSLLYDKSYKVRRLAIPIIAEAAEKNPIEIIPTITLYVSEFISTGLSLQNPSLCAKNCSLLPDIAHCFIQFKEDLVPTLVYVCVSFLLRGDDLPTHATENDLQKVIHRDFSDQNFNQQPVIPTSNINFSKLYQIENEKWLEKRDVSLLKTLGYLAKRVTMLANQIIPVYEKVFTVKHVDSVYLAALESLQAIITECTEQTDTLPSIKQLYTPLINILSSGTCSRNVAIAILKLAGVTGASRSIVFGTAKDDDSVEHMFAMKNPSYFASFVLSSLTAMLSHDFSPSVYQAITHVFAEESIYAIPFLEPVLKGFAKALEHTEEKDELYMNLEMIVQKCQLHVVPFVPILTEQLKADMQDIPCLRVAAALSFYLGIEFKQTASILYPVALHSIDHPDLKYFTVLAAFLSYAVAFQDQNFGSWMAEIEERVDFLDEARLNVTLKHFSMLVQLGVIDPYCARVSQLCFRLVMMNKKSKNLDRLFIDLCTYSDVSLDVINRTCQIYGHNVHHLSDLDKILKHGGSKEELPFIKKRRLTLNDEHLQEVTASLACVRVNPFNDLPNLVFNNAKQWIDELCVRVVANSPSPAIRACSLVMNQSQSFRHELFPIAFLSSWRTASHQDKATVSNTIKMILQNFENKVPELIELAGFLDRSGCPLLFSDDVLAESSDSTPFCLFFLQRYLLDHPDDKTTIENLLKLNSRMGRIESARGLLTSVAGIMDQKEAGKWSEELGEWDKALELYESEEGTSSVLRCYSHLELWDKIRDKTEEFDSMPDNEKRDNAIWYAWAFYHSNDFERVKSFVRYFEDESDFNSILFKCLFLISTKNYADADECIKKGFQELTKNLNIYGGSDANRASRNMVFAQHLVELQEVLSMKQQKRNDVPKMWQHRLHDFSHESDAWTKLIEIRSLVLAPAKHTGSYLKMLSVLRKERRWKLIDGYLNRFFSGKSNLDVLVSRLKIMWARGLRSKAALLMQKVNEMVNGVATPCFSDIDPADQDLLLNSVPSDVRSLSDQKRARMLRLQATWQFELQKGSPDVCEIFKKSNDLVDNDYRTWARWAYANSAISVKTPEISLNAIKGFLRAAQLRPSDSLEYLCQMFSIFFLYGEEFEVPPELVSEIVSLPPSIVIQIIPQIVVHIAHNGTSVRQTVSRIIENFGSQHFQAVVFPLNVLSLISDSDKATVARDLMQSLGSRDQVLFDDLLLFIDGMHRSAVSFIEQWITALDATSQAFHKNDKETIIRVTTQMLSHLQKVQCEQDRDFVRMFNTSLQRIRTIFEKFKRGEGTAVRPLWDAYRAFYSELEERMKKTETLQLGRISEDLAKKTDFSFAVPGTYCVDGKPPLLHHIEPILQVLSTQQHPRSVIFVDDSAKKRKFLLKGNEDLRLDQRIMQFFALINSLLRNNRFTSDKTVSIVQYAIIPFAPNAGLISWVTGADTFQQLVNDFRAHRDIKKTLEQEMYVQLVGGIFNQLHAGQRQEVFENIAAQTKANELREILWLRSPTPSAWTQRNRNFTVSTALMSMAGYVIGLGDRHPSNIMVQRHTGRVIHIDFGDSFEVALRRAHFAERVPFRMTRMIVNALDGGSVEGLFRKACEDVLYVLRENQSSIAAQLEVFVHEPIFSGKTIRSADKAKEILERVTAKLSGKDPIEEGETEISVDQQVDRLIQVACDRNEYVRHFIGWCPFW